MISIPRALPVYQTLGDLWLDFGAAGGGERLPPRTGPRYRHRHACATPRAAYTTRVKCSLPRRDTCIVVRLTADKPGSISFRATITRPADATSEAAPGRPDPDRPGAAEERAAARTTRGVRFRAEVKATVSGGRMANAADRLDIAGADSVTLTIVAATEIREKDLAAACARDLAAARPRVRSACATSTWRITSSFFRRVRLELPVDAAARALPTDERLKTRAERRKRRRPVRALLPVRTISADRQQPARKHGGQSSGQMERQPDAGLGQQVHHQHQHRDELLAGGDHQSLGTA